MKKFLIVGLILSAITIVFVFSNSSFFCVTWDCIEIISDDNGITMVDYKNLWYLNIGKVYNPFAVDDINWFMNNFEDHGDYFLIPFEYDWYYCHLDNECKLEKPFYSCEAQGNALVLSIKKYQETNNEEYLNFADKIFQSFIESPLVENYWFQGFYHRDIGGTYIMNSQLICLLAVYDYYELTNNPMALEIFEKGIVRLENEIDYFTTDGGTTYDKLNDNFKSHEEHPEYLELLNELSDKSKSAKLTQIHLEWLADSKR